MNQTTIYYACSGAVRGDCGHHHRTLSGAQRCLERDRRGCRFQGGYSDRDVYRVTTDGARERVADKEC